MICISVSCWDGHGEAEGQDFGYRAIGEYYIELLIDRFLLITVTGDCDGSELCSIRARSSVGGEDKVDYTK